MKNFMAFYLFQRLILEYFYPFSPFNWMLELMLLQLSWYHFEKALAHARVLISHVMIKGVLVSILKFVVLMHVFQHLLTFGVWAILGIPPAILKMGLVLAVFLVCQKNLFGSYIGILNQGKGIGFQTVYYQFLLYFSFLTTYFLIHTEGLISFSSGLLLSQTIRHIAVPILASIMILHILMRIQILTPKTERWNWDWLAHPSYRQAVVIATSLNVSSFGVVLALIFFTVVLTEASWIHQGAERASGMALAVLLAAKLSICFTGLTSLSYWLIVPAFVWNRMSTAWFPILASPLAPSQSVDHWIDKKWPEEQPKSNGGGLPRPGSEIAFSI